MTTFNHRAWRLAVMAHEDLTEAQKVILLSLGEHADYSTGKRAHPGLHRLMEMTGAGRATVWKALKAGSGLGLIAQTASGVNAGARNWASTYDLCSVGRRPVLPTETTCVPQGAPNTPTSPNNTPKGESLYGDTPGESLYGNESAPPNSSPQASEAAPAAELSKGLRVTTCRTCADVLSQFRPGEREAFHAYHLKEERCAQRT